MRSKKTNTRQNILGLIGNQGNTNNVRINLARDLNDVAALLLIALFTSANYPRDVEDEEVHQEITTLLDAEDWDGLVVKGFNWIQDIVGMK
jgi:hypothetical protein